MSTLDSQLLTSGMTEGDLSLNTNQHVVFRRMDINFRSMDMLNIHIFGYKGLYIENDCAYQN